MTITVAPVSRNVSVLGGSFLYGTYVVTVNGVEQAEYPAHFAFNASGSLVNPMTNEVGLQLVNAIQALTIALQSTGFLTSPTYAAFLATLPSTPPTPGSGILWNNNGVLVVA